MSGRLDGKVALITGSARGMGASIARLFAEEGARVVLSDILEAPLKALELELSGRGYEVLAQRHDVIDEASWEQIVQATETRFGRLDVLVNNAGVLDTAGVEASSLEAWERVVAVNQTGVWLGMKVAIPALRRSGGGSIVNTSSI